MIKSFQNFQNLYSFGKLYVCIYIYACMCCICICYTYIKLLSIFPNSSHFFIGFAEQQWDLFWMRISWSIQIWKVWNSLWKCKQPLGSPLLLLFLFTPPLMLTASEVSPLPWPLTSLSNDLIFPSCLPTHHRSRSLPSFPGDHGIEDFGGKGADGGLPLLVALSLFTLTIVCYI